MDRRTPRPARPPEDAEDSMPAPSAPLLPDDCPRVDAGSGNAAQTPAPDAPFASTVATYQAQIAYLSDRSIVAADCGDYEHKRKVDYVLAFAYAHLGEALLRERTRLDADDERQAEWAMTCFSDAATLFHGLGAADERDHALRLARRAHELYSW